MKLYYAPGACSLADHIALHEAGLSFDRVKVDLKAKRGEDGSDYSKINPKGYVPALKFDDGQVLTENIAILAWVARNGVGTAPAGELGPFRVLEMLAFISTEIHKSFKPFFDPSSDQTAKDKAGQAINKRLQFLADGLQGDYLFGPELSVADCYLFVMLLWSGKMGLAIPAPLEAFRERMTKRPAVLLALQHEGLA
jgi:glutathione S-transferase